MTQPSLGITSSIRNSPAAAMISVRRGEVYFAFISSSSFLIRASSFASESRMPRSSSISFISSRYSASILPRSRPVNWYRRSSRIASVWRSDRGYFAIRRPLASSRLAEARMIRTKSSRLSRAMM